MKLSEVISIKFCFIIFLMVSGSKFSYSQNFSWAKTIGGQSHDHGTAVVTDANGNIYVTGMFRHTADFDPGSGILNMITPGDADVFILKLDPSGNLIWTRQVGSTADDNAESISLDASNSVVVSGYYQGPNDFDPGSGVFSLPIGHNAFVLKLDSSGTFEWASSIGDPGSIDYGYSTTIDNNNDIISTGSFDDSTDADPGSGVVELISNGYSDIFIQKLSESGNLIWAKSIGGSHVDIGYSITTDDVNNIYLTGTFRDTVDFDPGSGAFNLTSLASIGFNNTFILKLNASGNFQWVKHIGGSSDITSSEIRLDVAGNVYVTGYFKTTADFDPGPGVYNLNSNGGKDVFVLKLDTSGNFIWANQIGGTLDDNGNTIATGNSGKIYITGVFRNTVDFDPGPGTNMQYAGNFGQIYIQTLNPNGTLHWIGHMGGKNTNNGFSCLDASENLITTGEFGDSIDFDMGWATYIMSPPLQYQPDIFIHKMDSASLVGLPNIYSNQEIKIFPNPVRDQLEIQLPNDVEAEFILYDVVSRKVLQHTFRKSTSLDTRSLTRGMYLYEIIISNGYRRGGKIIKE